jgi:6-phosphofructokinase
MPATLVFQTKKYFKEIGVHADVKYIDPTYMIRACRANASDGILCTVLGQNAVSSLNANYIDFVLFYSMNSTKHTILSCI